MRPLNAKQREELTQLHQSARGLLRPEQVVAFARDENTALHGRFEWDDSKAGQAYRLWQARSIIQLVVEVLPKMSEPVRMFVSLERDRKEGNGYRSVEAVLNRADLRAEMMAEALGELERVRLKYSRLTELEQVWAAVERVSQLQAKRKPRRQLVPV